MTARPRTVRLSPAVDAALEAHARESGQTITQTVEAALCAHLGIDTGAGQVFADAFTDLIASEFPADVGFPEDVTLRLFRMVRDDEALHGLWLDAVRGTDGHIDRRKRQAVNQQGGRAVKTHLGATVTGRRDAAPEDLIETFSLLAP